LSAIEAGSEGGRFEICSTALGHLLNLSMQTIEVSERASDADRTAWQSYVSRAPAASLYHGAEWEQILHDTFGHRSRYLIARKGGYVCGVLPMFEIRSWVFGHFLTSLPFVNYGGIIADTQEAAAALVGYVENLAERISARHVELRQCFDLPACTSSGWALRQHKAALVVSLGEDPGCKWDKLSSRLRGKVRKAEKSGAVFKIGDGEMLDDFYRVFALNMRDLGTPVQRRDMFQNVVRLSKGTKLLLVYRDGRSVAAALALRHGDRIELPWICSDYSQTKYNLNEFLYWNAIVWAGRSGARELDLGRSSIGAGTYKFKIQWNAEVRPLYWYYWVPDGVRLPELNPDNPNFALAIRFWKKLPLAVANLAGPRIARNIP
jgi:FemAB-related protein (PEP-CTERM system-associated)